ncbi:MAG: hypothetical protein KF777_05850 [Planctomycetaceae bacterium]|nr:hypothetical protein [Planctomycetaceae bacterium]
MKRPTAAICLVLAMGICLSMTPGANSQDEEPVSALTALQAGPVGLLPGDWIVALGETGPVMIEIEIRVSGKTLRERWLDLFDQLDDLLDADRNGRVSVTEFQRLLGDPQNQDNGNQARRRDPDLNGDGAIGRRELFEEILARDLGPFSMSEVSATPGEANSLAVARIFRELDSDQNGLVTADDLRQGYERLRQFDLDQDETISIAELQPSVNMQQPRPMRAARGTPRSRFLALANQQATEIAQQILVRYDSSRPNSSGGTEFGRDGRLSATEISGMRAAQFQAFDANRDGQLDPGELADYVRRAPADVAILVRFANATAAASISAQTRLDRIAIPSSGGSSLRMILDEANLILSAAPPGRPAEEFSESLFRRLDLDANDYLEAAEARSGGVDILPPFDVLDADKDDRVYLTEWQAVIVPRILARSLPFRLEIREEGRQLFELIDSSRDGRLTRREFLDAARSLGDWDRDNDQALADRELPDVWRATGRFGLADFQSAEMLPAGFARNTTGESVPGWFTAMDRNSDGDISAREFPGSVIRFLALDRDGDGLISPAEAVLARPAP